MIDLNLIDLSPNVSGPCDTARSFQSRCLSSVVELGQGSILRKNEYAEGGYPYYLRLYLDFGIGKGECECSMYDWYIVTVRYEGEGRYSHYEVIIGEGPCLDSLISNDFLGKMGFSNLRWESWNEGILGVGFEKWLEDNDQVID